MSLTDTPNANRLHIALFGRRNSGKSSLINALTGQDTALVSDTPGTTTDPVAKAMEIHGIGPCLFIDTPGFDDEGELGRMRIERTWKAVEKTDMAILFCGGDTSAELSKETKEPDFTEELYWLEQLKAKGIPTILLINKTDIRKDSQALAIKVRESFGDTPVLISAKEKTGIEQIRRTILEKLPPDFGQQSITGTLVAENDLVLLVMPQDIQAPKGRLILPQVQTIRELLDKKCLIVTCTTDKLPETLHALAHPPKLIITDSQVFKTVYEQKPEESKLTSFSVLFAGYKGDIHYYVKSAAAIEMLTESSRVLIAEACTHAPLSEDIGRVKLPRLLRKRIGEKLQIDIVGGTDFPQETPTGADAVLQVRGHAGRGAEAGDGDILRGQTLVLSSLALSRQSGGVVADDDINISIRVEDGLANADGLSRILIGVVRIMHRNPSRILFLDVSVAGDVPGVLVRHGRVGEVPDVLDFAVHVHAALLQGVNSHFNQHRSKDARGALGNHQRTGVRGDVRVPGADIDARVLSFLELLVQTGRVNGRDADRVHTLIDRLLDQLQLGGHVSGRCADVVNSQTPLFSVLLGAVVRSLEERVAGNLRDEGDGHAIHRALAFGKSGGAQRQSHAQHEKHRQDLFHVWVPPTFYLSQEVLNGAP